MNSLEIQEVVEDKPNNEYESGASSGDDSDEEENSLRKLENNVQKQFLLDFHPEIKQINFEELDALCTIIRNKKGDIIDKLHKTLPYLTKYERARVLGIRTKQIQRGSQIFIETKDNIIDGYIIACKELEEKKIPFIIQRPLPNGICEYWKLSDLELI